MNKIKLRKIAIAGLCIVILVIAIGIFGDSNNSPLKNNPLTTSTMNQTGSTSSNDPTSAYKSKVSAITKNSNAILNDSYNVLDGITKGTIDENTAVSRLQNDKKGMAKTLSEIQSLNPPQNMQQFHTLLVAGLQDLDKALALEITGIKNSNVDDLQRAVDLTSSAISKLNEAEKIYNQTN